MAHGAMGDPGRRVRIVDIKVTLIAFRDPPLRNAAGVHEPYALRSIIEITASNGQTGLGEGYGDAASLMALEAVAPRLIGLEITDLNGLRNSIGETLAGLPPLLPARSWRRVRTLPGRAQAAFPPSKSRCSIFRQRPPGCRSMPCWAVP